MRRTVLILALGAATAAAGCGGDRPVIRPVAADDPATLACAGLRSPVRETCVGSFFQCREQVREIVDDMDVDGQPEPARISVAYAKSFWSDWDPATRAAARRGCRGGLPR